MRKGLVLLGLVGWLLTGMGYTAVPHAQERITNNSQTTLLGDITNSATSITVNTSTGFPTTGTFHAILDAEIVKVTAISGTTWTISRGEESSTATTHNDGTIIRLIVTAASLRSLQDYAVDQGRLTTESGVCVSTSDRTSQTTIYWTPCGWGGRIGTWTTTNEWVVNIPGELSLALGTITSGKNYDVFIACAPTCTLSMSSAWTNDTTRADALAQQDGVDVLSSDHTKRFLGTFRTTSTTTTEDSGSGTTTVGGKRFLWNRYNPVQRSTTVFDSTTSWNTSSGWRIARGQTAPTNCVEYVSGATMFLDATVVGGSSTTSGTKGVVAVGLDGTTPSGVWGTSYESSGSTSNHTIVGRYSASVALGYHYIAWLERSDAGTVTFIGNDGATSKTGLTATIWN